MELGSLSTTALNQSLGKSLGFLAWFSYLHNEEIELDSFYIYRGSIGGSVVKNPLYHFTLCGKESTLLYAGDTGSIPGLERSSGEGHGNPLQSTVHGVLATVHGITKESDMT